MQYYDSLRKQSPSELVKVYDRVKQNFGQNKSDANRIRLALLLTLPNTIATYHTAGVTHEARRNVATMGSAQIIEVLRGGRPPRLVNPEVWPVFVKRYDAVKNG